MFLASPLLVLLAFFGDQHHQSQTISYCQIQKCLVSMDWWDKNTAPIPPIAGWFMFGKIPSRKLGWWLGVPYDSENHHIQYCNHLDVRRDNLWVSSNVANWENQLWLLVSSWYQAMNCWEHIQQPPHISMGKNPMAFRGFRFSPELSPPGPSRVSSICNVLEPAGSLNLGGHRTKLQFCFLN